MVETPAPPPPSALVDLVLRQGAFAAARRPDIGATYRRWGNADAPHRRYALGALDKELSALAATPEGQRNDALNKSAFALGTLVGSGLLPESIVRAALENVVSGWPNLRKSQATISSGLRAGADKPRDMSAVGRGAGRPSGNGRPGQPTAGARSADPPPADGGWGEGDDALDPAVLEKNAAEPPNDTGNAFRLLRWFGDDIVQVRNVGPLVWIGSNWELETGSEAFRRFAQRTAARISAELPHILPTQDEADAIAAADAVDPAVLASDGRRLGTPDQKRLKREAIAIYRRGEEAAAAVAERSRARIRFAIASGNSNRIDNMAREATAQHAMTISPGKLDADPLAINVLNGTLRFEERIIEEIDPDCPDPDIERKVEVRRWELRADPHRRSDLISKLMPVEYDPSATCPRWLEFVERFQPNTEIREYLQTYHGYALTGITDEQIFVFCHGTGANGKTTFIETLAGLMGSYAAALPSEALTGDMQRRGDQATPEFARLPGARLVRCSELARGQGFREHTIKLLTGGETILVRHLHRDFFEMKPTFKAIGSGNERPKISGVDEGIWRRMRLVPWPVSIPLRERRPLSKVLAEFRQEASGILNWLLEGLRTYLECGLVTPRAILAATESYRRDMDPVGEFCDSCIVAHEGAQVGARDMYNAYTAWCHANSVKQYSEKAFSDIMMAKGFEKEIKRTRRYINCVLMNVPIDPDAAGRQPYGEEVER